MSANDRVLSTIGKVVIFSFTFLSILIASVMYLEHRFNKIELHITELSTNTEHLQQDVSELKNQVGKHREDTLNALKAIDRNQYEIATEVIYCCEAKSQSNQKKRKVKPIRSSGAILGSSAGTNSKDVGDLLPYDLQFDSNPGMAIVKR